MSENSIILAHHLVLSGYGFWLANDPRGSGSVTLREEKFEEFGAIHPGRKRIQPTRAELREFYRRTTPRLEHAPIWLTKSMRDLIALELERIVARFRYTIYACSIGVNHVHICVRRHRDRYQNMFENIAGQTRVTFAAKNLIDPAHPLWANRPYSVYCHTPEDIRRVVDYIEKNPAKGGLPRQAWTFVTRYDGWPFARRGRDATR